MLSKGYNYVGFGYAMNLDNQRRYWTGVFLKGPDRTGAVAQFVGVVEVLERRLHRDQDPLVRRRPPPAGPDLRPPLLPGPAARRGRHVEVVELHDRDVQDGPLLPGQGQGVPRPIPGQGRQLEQLGSVGILDASAADPSTPPKQPRHRPDHGAVSCIPGQRDPFDAAELGVCAEGGGEGRHERRLGQGVEAVLPPQPDDPERFSRRSIRGSIRPTSRSPNRIGST